MTRGGQAACNRRSFLCCVILLAARPRRRRRTARVPTRHPLPGGGGRPAGPGSTRRQRQPDTLLARGGGRQGRHRRHARGQPAGLGTVHLPTIRRQLRWRHRERSVARVRHERSGHERRRKCARHAGAGARSTCDRQIRHDAQARSSDTIAIGSQSRALASNATAIGTLSKSIGANSTSLGHAAAALDLDATAVGNGALAQTGNATAIGSNAIANGAGATAIGQGTMARGNGSAALGNTAFADGEYASAIGGFPRRQPASTPALSAPGPTPAGKMRQRPVGKRRQAAVPPRRSVQVRYRPATPGSRLAPPRGRQHQQRRSRQWQQCGRTSSVAVGQGATATHANAAAWGQGLATARDNQQLFGNTSNTYTMTGIASAASGSAQSGPLLAVTSDAAGNLAATDPNNLFRWTGTNGAAGSRVRIDGGRQQWTCARCRRQRQFRQLDCARRRRGDHEGEPDRARYGDLDLYSNGHRDGCEPGDTIGSTASAHHRRQRQSRRRRWRVAQGGRDAGDDSRGSADAGQHDQHPDHDDQQSRPPT